MQMLGNLGEKRNFIFSALHLLSKKRFRATDSCTNSRCSALQRICASFSLFCVRAQGTLATQLLVVNGKKKNFTLLNFVPPPPSPNCFDSFALLV